MLSLLSLDRGVLGASVAALRTRTSAATSGPMKDGLARIAPTTSKMMLVNVGGAAQLLRPQMNFGSLNEEQAQQVSAALDQIVHATANTTIELGTDENANRLVVNSCVSGVPPLAQVIGPVSQIARIAKAARAEAEVLALRQSTPVLIMPAFKAPGIDGLEDDVWVRSPRRKLAHVVASPSSGETMAPISSPDDLSADFRALWDQDGLYLLVDVVDDKLISDTDPANAVTVPSGSRTIPWWYDDSIEVFLDAENAKSPRYGTNDLQLRFNWGDKPSVRAYNQNVEVPCKGLEFAMVRTDKGYRLETKLPWNSVQAKPTAGATVGLDVHINDDDDGGERDNILSWHDTNDSAWQSPQAFGNGLLGGLVGWWKCDETEGKVAKDSSGANHDGALVGGATWSPGKLGGAIKLDGQGSFARIADKSAFGMADQVTLAGWVNIRSVPVGWMTILSKGDNAWRVSTQDQERKFHASVNRWDRVSVNGSTTVGADEWHHIAAVHDGKELKLYLDGKLEASTPWTEGIGRNDFDVLIGENDQEKGRCFDGLLDDVRVYNCALDQSEIAALAAGP